MSFFQRVFKNVQSQAHSAMDKLEDPIKLSELVQLRLGLARFLEASQCKLDRPLEVV